ncbi:MAG TPA: LysM domain-containing protein [Anaerolineales bacterium]|nr:LysM domain-containing protein [Anaerolineales bacterium]
MNAPRKALPIVSILILVFGMLAASFQPGFAATETAACKQWHTVQRGEYLSMIAKMYNTDWRTLAEINNLKDPSRIYPGQKLCVSTTSGGSVVVPDTSGSGRVYAYHVKEDVSVTLRGKNLSASTRYTIYLSKYGADFSKAILTGWASTDKYGSFEVTLNIPSKLADIMLLSVSVYSKAGDKASNWFVNATAEGNTGGTGMLPLSFKITSVKKDAWVKIQTTNLLANVPFDVYLGKAGSKGVEGFKVGTLLSSKGGSVKETYEIPANLQGKGKFDIRLENKMLGIAVYLTVENKTN